MGGQADPKGRRTASRPPTPTRGGEFEGAKPPHASAAASCAKHHTGMVLGATLSRGVGKGEARAAAEWLRSAPQGAGEVGITFT